MLACSFQGFRLAASRCSHTLLPALERRRIAIPRLRTRHRSGSNLLRERLPGPVGCQPCGLAYDLSQDRPRSGSLAVRWRRSYPRPGGGCDRCQCRSAQINCAFSYAFLSAGYVCDANSLANGVKVLQMPVIPICSQQKSRQEKSRQENTRRVANECVCDLLAKAHLGYPLLIPREARDQAPAAERLSSVVALWARHGHCWRLLAA
jgi:hypothetical protein